MRFLYVARDITLTKNLEKESRFITERLNEQNKTLNLLATRDTLTGVYNRRALYTYIEEQWSRAVRNNEDCCVVMIDIDHFKKVNDTYGHQSGDDVLAGVAKTLDSIRRPYDRLGRWGGEEFMLFLPGTNIENAEKIAERLRENVSQKKFYSEDESEIRITISMGISGKKLSNTLDLDLLFNHADKALYDAKENGRNRVCVFENISYRSPDKNKAYTSVNPINRIDTGNRI